MISIIQNGKEKTYYARCNKCGSEMEYEHSDVKYETSSYNNATQRYIVCPVCGETILVNLMTKEEVQETKRTSSYAWGFNACCC